MKRLGWSARTRHLLDQPLLMQDLLAPWEEEVSSWEAATSVGQASLLWKIVYATAALPAPSMTPSFSSVTRIWPSRRSPNSQLSIRAPSSSIRGREDDR